MALETVIQELVCELTEEERDARAAELARSIPLLLKLDEEKKVWNADWKDRKAELDERIQRLADAKNNGTELRDVECEQRWNRDTRRVHVHRMDTGAFVFSRELDPGEGQTDIEDSDRFPRGRH